MALGALAVTATASDDPASAMTLRSRLALSFFLAAVATAPLCAQKGIAEPAVGFEFKPPKGWVELPGGGDRGATLRLFAAPRATAGKEEGFSHTAVMRVMFFPKGGDATKDIVDGLPRKTAYRGLEDFASRGLQTTKVEVTKEAGKAGTFDGQRVRAKITGGGEERLLVGHAIALDDGEAAICIELLASQGEKLKKDVEGAIDSLAACPRQKPTTSIAPWIADPKSWTTMDAGTRGATRKKWADELVAATTKAPGAAFKVSKSKYWTVLSAADAGYTKKAIAAAEAARAWCAQKMPELGKDPLPAVLRVFDSPDHYKAYLATLPDNRDYDASRRELYCYFDPDNSGPTSFGMICRAVLWQMFDDVDPLVLPGLPRWFDNGCWSFMYDVKFDGKKLEFAAGEVERGRIEYQLRQNGMPAIWNLIQESQQPSPADGANEKPWEYTPESGRLMRWLWMADGGKAFDKPNLVADYVRAVGKAHAASGIDPTADVALVELSDQQSKQFNKAHYAWRDELLKQINNIALPLQPDAWQGVNTKWLEFVKSSK